MNPSHSSTLLPLDLPALMASRLQFWNERPRPLLVDGMSTPENPTLPKPRRISSRLPRPMWIGLTTVLLAVAAVCLRFDVFASASAPPSPGWRDELFIGNALLQNAPVIVTAVIQASGMTVTVKNEGTTTLEYSSEGRSTRTLIAAVFFHLRGQS